MASIVLPKSSVALSDNLDRLAENPFYFRWQILTNHSDQLGGAAAWPETIKHLILEALTCSLTTAPPFQAANIHCCRNLKPPFSDVTLLVSQLKFIAGFDQPIDMSVSKRSSSG